MGGTSEIAPGPAGNGAGNAEKPEPAARGEAERLRNQGAVRSTGELVRNVSPVVRIIDARSPSGDQQDLP